MGLILISCVVIIIYAVNGKLDFSRLLFKSQTITSLSIYYS